VIIISVHFPVAFVWTVSKEKLTLADTLKAKKRQRLDKEKENLMAEIMQRQQKTAEPRAYQGLQSGPKSHYMYNTPLIPKVVVYLLRWFLYSIIIVLIVIITGVFLGSMLCVVIRMSNNNSSTCSIFHFLSSSH